VEEPDEDEGGAGRGEGAAEEEEIGRDRKDITNLSKGDRRGTGRGEALGCQSKVRG